MRTIITISMLLCLSYVAKSQDLIIKKNGEDIQAKVIEINNNEIKFKKYDNQNGPLYTVPKNEVLLIRYENGAKDVFKTEQMNISAGTNNIGKLYFSFFGGKGLAAAPQTRGVNFNGTSYSIPKGNGSYGRGIQFGGALGVFVGKNISTELEFSYLKSDEQTTTYNTPNGKMEDAINASMVRLTPSIRISTGGEKVSLYTRIGWVCALNTNLKVAAIENFNNTKYESEYESTGGFSQGFMGALGSNFMISDKVEFYTELAFIAQSWAPNKSTLTKYQVNGNSYLGALTQYSKEVEYVDSYTPPSSINYDESEKRLKEYLPFSSIGINIGLRIKLN
ncbi:MAG: hypothetical protein ACK44D_14505 [Bacteroidia bacterium]